MANKKRKESRASKKSYKQRVSYDIYLGLDGKVHKRKKPLPQKYIGLDGKVHISP